MVVGVTLALLEEAGDQGASAVCCHFAPEQTGSWKKYVLAKYNK